MQVYVQNKSRAHYILIETQELILNILFPRRCIACGSLGHYLCPDCLRYVEFFQFPLCPGCGKPIRTLGVHTACTRQTNLDSFIALAPHKSLIKTLIEHIKYHDHFDMTITLAELMTTHLPSQYRSSTGFVPVPLHKQRQRERGYNQSQLIAQHLTDLTGIPTIPLLTKERPTSPQALLTKKERLTNLEGAFSCPYKLKKHQTFVLIDDVMTTGTTINTCAKVLKERGAGKVYGLVVAHGH